MWRLDELLYVKIQSLAHSKHSINTNCCHLYDISLFTLLSYILFLIIFIVTLWARHHYIQFSDGQNSQRSCVMTEIPSWQNWSDRSKLFHHGLICWKSNFRKIFLVEFYRVKWRRERTSKQVYQALEIT